MCFERDQECFAQSSLNCDLPSIYNNTVSFSFHSTVQNSCKGQLCLKWGNIYFLMSRSQLYNKNTLCKLGSTSIWWSLKNTICQRKLFKWVSSVHQVAKILEFQLQCQSFQWTPRTDLFRMDWLDLLAIQGTLKSLLQHHSSKASILQTSAFFVAQLSHPYMTTGKTIALTGWTFVGKTNWFIWKDPDAGKDWGQEEKGTKEDEMVGWRHRLNQWAWAWVNSGSWWWTEGLVCYSPCPLSQMWLGDWTELNWKKTFTEWLSYK